MATSYYNNQVAYNTSVGASLSQGLFEHYTLSVSGSYNWNTYKAAASGAAANSSGEYYSVSVSLGTTILKRVSASVFYSYSDNTTAQAGQAFTSSQVGFNLSYSY